MKVYRNLAITGVVSFALLQLVRPGIPAKHATAEVGVPPQVRHILEKDCYSCHSDEPRLSWFDRIEPGYWLVRYDILAGRKHLDFSTVGSKPAAAQKAALYEAINMIQLVAMPLPRFLKLHPEARGTPEELAILKAFLAPWKGAAVESGAKPPPGNPPSPSLRSNTASAQPPVSLPMVKPEFNGLPFDPGFENWKPLSFSDRGDNNTFRFILGNEIAVRAAQSGHITPWPDGSRFAKIAWQQKAGPDGLIYPGDFVQVEFMLKDGERYKSTDGWGWGRWRGLDLEPYGKDRAFAEECTSCHAPMHGNDYVYTPPMTTARVTGQEIVNNQAASLPASLPYQPLDWNAVTMYVDPNARTMSALYGNSTAMHGLQVRSKPSDSPALVPGSILALVTWVQRDDPHWFGARIPAVPQSVEFVQVATGESPNEYRRFSGRTLMEDHLTTAEMAQRMRFILSLNPAPLP